MESPTASLRPGFVVSSDGRSGRIPVLAEDVARIERSLDAPNARTEGLPGGAPRLRVRLSTRCSRETLPSKNGR